MLSTTDFIGLSNLYECEVEVIADHEHVSLATAVLIGEQLLTSDHGVCMLHLMVAEAIQAAVDDHDVLKAKRFADAYAVVKKRHPLPKRC